ncbi:MAG: metallophosphoesterase [Oscillospiraceae bacterium]|jgi:predicted phosphohydrolase|nr:metallophosphoesterase [Oscillospiraceae bacterium]
MSLFAIADLHLSLGGSKPMNIFKGWDNHVEKLLGNWNSIVGKDDTVVIAGDTSWAANLEEALPDLEFIGSKLHGRKIILKGNHDYWWTSLSKLNSLNFNNINFLHRNAFVVDNIAICGTRGWFNEADREHNEKLQKREEMRLEASVKCAVELGEELCAFLHYPPVCGGFENYALIDVLQRHGVKRCFYGHLHGNSHKNAVIGTRYGIEFTLISADFVEFTPVRI